MIDMMKALLIIHCMLMVIAQYELVWAQRAFDVLTVLPPLPPPPLYNKEVNDSVLAFVGESVVVGENIRVIIDCGRHINDSIAISGILIPTVTWYDNYGNSLNNGNTAYAEISADGRQCIFPKTAIFDDSQVNRNGNYTCEVCTGPDICVNMTTELYVCAGEPYIVPTTSQPIINPSGISFSCGQDIILPSLKGAPPLIIKCEEFNGTGPLTLAVFKNDVYIGSCFNLSALTPDDCYFGSYNFVLVTGRCGHAVAEARILRQVPVGHHVVLVKKEHVIIDCGSLINSTVGNGGGISDVVWYKDGVKITNGSIANVVVSESERECIITEALLAVGSKPGNNGNYTCEVCCNPSTCSNKTTSVHVCDEIYMLLPTGPPIITPDSVSVTCGQDVTISSSTLANVSLSCSVSNSAQPIVTEVFKDGVSIGSSFTRTIAPFGDDDFGTYTFVASTEGCREITAVTRILNEIPLCSHDVCRRRDNNKLCIIPGSVCLCKPQLAYCSTAYFSTEIRAIPEECTICINPADVNCLKKWSNCVKRSHGTAYGRASRQMRTAANFKMYSHPC